MPHINLHNLGVVPYKQAWDIQERLLQTAIEAKKNADDTITAQNTLLICQHPHVYTLGKHGQAENLLFNQKTLQEKGIEFYLTNRGGDITYHGPGQLVAYPVLDLEQFGSSVHKYLRNLEEVVIQTLAEYGITSERIQGATGVWIDAHTPQARKICAIGVRCSRWVSIHGLALNVNTDLDYFNNIIPCGIRDKGVTAMQVELNRPIDEAQLLEVFLDKFKIVFETEFHAENCALAL